ncbi:MAG TPA: hypothetical protein VGH19_20285 [Verrucomicrobiae bacterium]
MAGRNHHTYQIEGIPEVENASLTLAEMLALVKSGKLTGASYVKRSDQEHWGTAADYPELMTLDTALSPQEVTDGGFQKEKLDPLTEEMEQAIIDRQLRGSSSWFFWIGALTMINLLISIFKGQWQFALGLETSTMISYSATSWGANGHWIGLATNILLILAMFGFGVAGWHRKFLPYAIGVAFYAMDFLFSLRSPQAISLLIHAWALYSLFKGLRILFETRTRH